MSARHTTSRGVGAPARARALRSSPGGYRSEGGRGRPTECGGLGSGSGASVEVSGDARLGRRGSGNEGRRRPRSGRVPVDHGVGEEKLVRWSVVPEAPT
ncbi:hornerin-like [Iris pallida]|uniref:Hornerin-like n=1 Tax=Iris pallida TaxID=29817 RepID=A0AAX6EGM4_IRIPA|nr:hornerin-like [Iris pallida]